MRPFLSACVFVALVSCLTAAPPDGWLARGAGAGGGLFEPAYSPHNPDELWVASDMGSLFVTTNAGTSWRRVPFTQIKGFNRGPVRFARDPKVLWSLDATPRDGGDAMRPSVSRDGGQTWKRVADPGWVESDVAGELYIDPERPDRVLVSGEGKQLFFAPDGKTFKSVFKAAGDNLMLGGAVFDGDEIVACTSHDGLVGSGDGGKTWQRLPADGLPRGVAISSFVAAGAGPKRRIFAVAVENAWQGSTGAEAGGFKGLYVLDPGSRRWERRTNGLNALVYYAATSPKDADVCYVAGMGKDGHVGPAVFKTTDGGKTWAAVFKTARNANVAAGWAADGGRFDWTWPEYALGLAVAPSDPDRVCVTDLGCIHQTKDGGKTWAQIYTTPTTPREPGKPGVRDDSYASRGLEVTSCWDVAWLGKEAVFGGYSDICGLYSKDGGKTWAWPRGHDDNSAYHVVRHPDGKAYLASSTLHDLYQSTTLGDGEIDGNKGSVRVSEDGGASWSLLHDFGAPVVRLAANAKQPNALYAAVVHSHRGGVYRTEQIAKGPAATWTRLAAPPRTEGHPYSLHALDDGTLVCTYSGRIAKDRFTPSSGVFVSGDGGRTWQDRSDPGMRFWTKDLVLDPNDPTQSTWYVGVFHAWGEAAREGKSGLYRTTDRGKTWQQVLDRTFSPSGVLNVESITFHPTRPGEAYVTTEYDGLWWSDDLKAARPRFWRVESYPFAHPTRVFFNPHQPGEVWVASFGAGLYVGREAERKP